jgi:DNA replication protein DnaC
MLSIEEVQAKYKDLRFNSIADSLETLLREAEDQEISYLQFADRMVEHEIKVRDDNRIALNRKRAAFPLIKRLEEFDYRAQSTISKKQVAALLDFQFVDNRENLIFIGPPGVGKTHLATAIAIKAIEAGYKILFKTAIELMETLELAEVRGELKKKINAIAKFDLIILDELGYLPMNQQAMFNLFQLINHLYEYRSIILTTNKEFNHWGDFFFDENVALPIIDRLIHHSRIFILGGESFRLRAKVAQTSAL